MRRFLTATLILASFSFGPVVVSQKSDTSLNNLSKLLSVGETAPEWQLRDADGNLHTLSQYRGKILVMDFWSTWCGPCKDVMSHMQKLHERYKDKEVVVIGVNSWEKQDPVEVMKKRHYDYGLLVKGEEIADAYRVTRLPAVYIIGVDSRIIYSYEGVYDKNLALVIDKYLKGR